MGYLSGDVTTNLILELVTSSYPDPTKDQAFLMTSGLTLQCPPGSCLDDDPPTSLTSQRGSVVAETKGNTSMSPATRCNGVHTGLVAPLVMAFFGVLGNVLALAVLYNTKTERRRSAFYTLVAGLALTDLLGQLCTSPIAIAAYSTGLNFFTDELCKLHGFLMVGFGLVTPLIVCLMALERMGALCCTYFCSRFMSKSRVRAALGGTWVFAMSFATLPFLGFGQFELQFPCSWCFLKFHFHPLAIVDEAPSTAPSPTTNRNTWRTPPAAYACLYALINLIVIAVTVASNIVVIVVLLKARKRRRVLTKRPGSYLYHSHRQHLQTQGASPESAKRKVPVTTPASSRGQRDSQQTANDLELQMVWLLCGMTLVFTCCWTPFMYKILESVLSGSAGFSAADVFVVRAAAFNQILDPWVYILLRRSLFRKVRGGLARVFRCRNSGGCGGRSTTTGRVVSGRHQQQGVSLLAADHGRSPGIVLDVVHTQGPPQGDPDLHEAHGHSRGGSSTNWHRGNTRPKPSADPAERQSLVKGMENQNGACPSLSQCEFGKIEECSVKAGRGGACEHQSMSPSHTSTFVTADVGALTKEDVFVYKAGEVNKSLDTYEQPLTMLQEESLGEKTK